MFKHTVQIEPGVDYDSCFMLCRFLRPRMRPGMRPVCALFNRRLSFVEYGCFPTRYLRCADCKKAEKAAEKGNA